MEEMGNMIAEVTKETKSVEITEVAGVANYIKDAISESLLEGVVKLDFPGNIKTETPPQKKEKKTKIKNSHFDLLFVMIFIPSYEYNCNTNIYYNYN